MTDNHCFTPTNKKVIGFLCIKFGTKLPLLIAVTEALQNCTMLFLLSNKSLPDMVTLSQN